MTLGRARFGATATFGLAGAMCAVWTVRIPALSDKLHLDPAALGTSALCFGVGAMLTMQSGRTMIARIGSVRLSSGEASDPVRAAAPRTAVRTPISPPERPCSRPTTTSTSSTAGMSGLPSP